MDQQIEQKIKEGLSQVRPFPHLVQNAIKLIDSGCSDTREIADVINKDPILTARLLSLANSSFYGMSKKISGVENACVILGNNIVKNILISAAAMECFPATEERKKIWTHSIEVATVSKLLAINLNQSPDKAYMAGLLHDVGKFLLLDVFPEYQAVIDSGYSMKYEQSMEDETKKLGFNHAQVGAKIIEMWNLPEEIQALVEKHHNPLEANDSVACSLLCLADEICHKLVIEKSDDDLLNNLKDSTLAVLFMDVQELKNMLPDIKQKISSLDGILEQME